MAQRFPTEADPDCPDSERYVFRKLGDALPDDWLVFHARRITLRAQGSGHPQEFELDFVIVDPARGWLGLEVKGGGVELADDGWFTTNRTGRRIRIKNPVAQVLDATHGLARYLGSRRPAVRLGHGWGVVLPDVDVHASLGSELPRPLVCDRGDFADLAGAMERLFDANGLRNSEPRPGGITALRDALAPRIRLVRTLDRELEEERAALVRLTEEQERVLDALEAMSRVAIEGAAGTGKTLLAMEWCRRLSDQGERVLLLCFNRPLADFLTASASGYTATNFHGLCHDLANEAGLDFGPPEGAREAQRYWDHEAPLVLLEALERLPDRRWDAIVVDEGQDFREDWWLAVEALLSDPEQGKLVAFYDPNQDLFGGGPPKALQVAPAKLRWNCRNTANIARYSAGVIGIEPELRPNAPEGRHVEVIRCATDTEMVDAVRRSLHQLVVEQRMDPEQIVILSTHSRAKSSLSRAGHLGRFTLAPIDGDFGPNQIRFGSLQRFKGLEADAIILTDVEPGAPTSTDTHVYVGSSRARHILIVVERLTASGNESAEAASDQAG